MFGKDFLPKSYLDFEVSASLSHMGVVSTVPLEDMSTTPLTDMPRAPLTDMTTASLADDMSTAPLANGMRTVPLADMSIPFFLLLLCEFDQLHLSRCYFYPLKCQ